MSNNGVSKGTDADEKLHLRQYRPADWNDERSGDGKLCLQRGRKPNVIAPKRDVHASAVQSDDGDSQFVNDVRPEREYGAKERRLELLAVYVGL